MRRPQTLNPATLLVDQHRRIGAAYAGPERINQGPNLIRRIDIAPEEYESPGPRVLEKGLFLGAERKARTAENTGSNRLRRTHFTKQDFPAALRAEQNVWASILDAKPPT